VERIAAEGPNAQQIEYWNDATGTRWVEMNDVIDAQISPLGEVAMAGVAAGERAFVLGATTTTANSGLLDHLIARFTAESGIVVRVVAVGTGAALNLGRRGDVDVVLVHDRVSEAQFVAQGHGVARHQVMHNDFVIVGPNDDPARIRGLDSAAGAFGRIAETTSVFASRGDDSGTHKKELGIWRATGVDAVSASGTWYRETGAGQGATLNTAVGMSAYAISDRGSWLALRHRGDLEILVEGDVRLHNPYGVVLVDNRRHPHVRAKEGQAFIDWLVSPAGQSAIASLTRDGRSLFIPNAVGATPGP